MANFIDREFAGEVRRFQLHPGSPHGLYRGLEAEGVGNLGEIAQRIQERSPLGATRVEKIIVHGLARGHPLTFLRMQELVRAEMKDKPLAGFIPLAIDIVEAALIGVEENG